MLSFLGLGIPRPTPAWGLMVADGRQLVALGLVDILFPRVGHHNDCVALNLLGDWMRDRLDPKMKEL